MNTKNDVLTHRIDGRSVHRRIYQKRDGRDLFLYGYQPHTLPPLSESNGDIAKGGDAVTFGALGARQTGGGFGGCIVACVPKASLEDWRGELLSKHTKAFWVA